MRCAGRNLPDHMEPITPSTAAPVPSTMPIADDIIHSYTHHVSLLKFIEKNWRLTPLTSRSRNGVVDVSEFSWRVRLNLLRQSGAPPAGRRISWRGKAATDLRPITF
jgi:hypothetical protein